MKLKCKECKADYTPDGSGNLCPKCYQKAVPEHLRVNNAKKKGHK